MNPAMFTPFVLCILAVLLIGAVRADLQNRRIPNKIVFAGAAIGLLLNSVLPDGFGFVSTMPGAVGLLKAFIGLGLGLVIMLPLYVLRAMGAGDVKLMAMVGAFLGPNAMLGTIVLTFFIGAGLSLIVVWSNGTGKRFFDNLKAMLLSGFIKLTAQQLPTLDASSVSAGKLPYAVPIATGTLAYIILAMNGRMDFLKIF
jgi:prepilin peptidase CpaA